jgi:hypothetical protein
VDVEFPNERKPKSGDGCVTPFGSGTAGASNAGKLKSVVPGDGEVTSVEGNPKAEPVDEAAFEVGGAEVDVESGS